MRSSPFRGRLRSVRRPRKGLEELMPKDQFTERLLHPRGRLQVALETRHGQDLKIHGLHDSLEMIQFER